MIHLDTNFLIRGLISGSPQNVQLRAWLTNGETVALSAIVWTEFLCGPVSSDHILMAEKLFANPEPFLPDDGRVAADWFNRSGRRRGTLSDCMIAAVAFRLGARFAAENKADFLPFVPWGFQLV